MHKVNPAKLFAALLFVAFAPAAARAQAGGANRTGSLVGVVWDSTRMSPLASALVGLKDTKFSVLTNVDGRFFIPNLPVGEYTVLVSHARLDSLRVLMPQVVVNILPDSQVTVSVALPVLSY